MAHPWDKWRRAALPLVASVGAALVVAAALVIGQPLASTAPAVAPTPLSGVGATVAVRAELTATRPLPPTSTLAPLPSSLAQPPSTPQLASPGATPALVIAATLLPATPVAKRWIEVGRWRDRQIIVTDAFTVQGPWRIRWQLDTATEPFTLMIEEGVTTPRLFTSPVGLTSGAINEARGGTYYLMLHNTVPYEVIVEEFGFPTPAAP